MDGHWKVAVFYFRLIAPLLEKRLQKVSTILCHDSTAHLDSMI